MIHATDKTKKKHKNKIKRQYKLEIGQTVRLSHVRGLFKSGPATVSKQRASACTGSNPGIRKK